MAVIAGVLAGIFIVYVVVRLLQFRGSDRWPTAEATVEAAEVQDVRIGDGHHYRPSVIFSYTVAGERYSGEWIGPPFHSQQDLAELIQRNCPVGAKLTARYKPQDPSRNLLDMDYSLWDMGKPITLDL